MKRNDIFLILIIAIIAIGLLIYFVIMGKEGSRVLITLNGEKYQEFSLQQDNLITIEDGEGKKNIVEIKDGRVKMIEASCPDKICVSHNEIHYDHETIVCLPNKVVVEILDGEKSEVDIIGN